MADGEGMWQMREVGKLDGREGMVLNGPPKLFKLFCPRTSSTAGYVIVIILRRFVK